MVANVGVSGSRTASSRAAAARQGEARPLPWPAAALTIAVLSAGLWLGIGWLVVTLL